MIDSASIGADFNNYRGDATAGGYDSGVLKIDTSPIMQMANYAVRYNESLWNQTQKEAADKVASLADISTLNPNNAIPKDKDEALKAFNDIVKFGSEYAKKTPKTNEEKIQLQLEWQAKIGQAKNAIVSANKRSLGYHAQKADIDGRVDLNGQQKKILYDKLDKEANSTDIYTPIAPVAGKFDLKVPKIGDPTYASVDVVQNTADGNGINTTNHKLFSFPSNMNSAFLDAQGLKGLQNRKATSDIEQTQFDLENASDNSQQVWNDASTFLNQALSDPKYKDKNDSSKIDFDEIKANNPMVSNIIDLANRANAYADKVKQDVASGVYTNNEGKTLVDPREYFKIDVSKGISPSQLVFLERFAKASPDVSDTKYTHTGDAIAAQKNEIGKMKAGADAIYKRAMAGAAGMKARAYVDNVKQQMKVRKGQQEQNQMLDDLFTKNLTEQPSLYAGEQINASSSLPVFTFSGNKPQLLRPIGATPIGEDGQPITDNSLNKKVAYYKGGHYKTQYIVNGKPTSGDALISIYQNQVKNSKFSGSYDDFLKQAIADKGTGLDVRIIGANGATDRQVSIAAQRAISNSATGKGETPVFSETDSNPPTEDAVVTDNTSPDDNTER